ncbi:MAG: VOC family protein [Treponema sp.]|jgi:predicted lactoylglutathione lyase|nr:VOC family protein [Treponema sp.]
MNRINVICLGVHDIENSSAFFKGIGFKTVEQNDHSPVVFFNNQGTKLELCPMDSLAKDINGRNPPEISEGKFCGISLAIGMKSEKEVDDFMELVLKNGGTIIKKPGKVFWGGYNGYFRDIDGYYWEAVYSPDWKYDKNGMLVMES